MRKRDSVQACNLLDVGDGDGYAGAAAVVLLHGVEDDAADVEIEAHADRVAGHQNIVAAVRVVEQARLRSPHLGRQRSVHHAHPTHPQSSISHDLCRLCAHRCMLG